MTKHIVKFFGKIELTYEVEVDSLMEAKERIPELLSSEPDETERTIESCRVNDETVDLGVQYRYDTKEDSTQENWNGKTISDIMARIDEHVSRGAKASFQFFSPGTEKTPSMTNLKIETKPTPVLVHLGRGESGLSVIPTEEEVNFFLFEERWMGIEEHLVVGVTADGFGPIAPEAEGYSHDQCWCDAGTNCEVHSPVYLPPLPSVFFRE